MIQIRRRLARGARTQQGAVAIIMALSIVGLLVVGGIVLDFGIVRMDRQSNKLATDDAVMAGLRAADGGSDTVYNVRGVCATLSFLKANRPALSGLPSNLETGGSCPAPSSNHVCVPGDATSAVRYHASTVNGNNTYEVWIKSPYDVGDPSMPAFPEESLASVTPGDNTRQGCDQIGVIIQESTKPGLGRIVTSNPLVTRIRSVGRVADRPGKDAPAMLLLKRTGCPVLLTGSASGTSYIHVYGAASTNGLAQAGTIHADTDGSGCPSSSWPFYGKGSDGIVAYAAPKVADPTVADPSKPGLITSVAGYYGTVAIDRIRDDHANIYSSAALRESGAAAAAKYEPSGRSLVTRSLVDDRYLGLGTTPLAGVKGAIQGAASAAFYSGLTPSNATSAPYNYTAVVACDGSANVDPAAMPATPLTAADKLYVDCTNNAGLKSIPQIDAGTIYFNGKINPSATISMPNAHHVYVYGSNTTNPAITIGGGSTLSMHTNGNLVGGNCTTATNPGSKAVLFIRNGYIKETGGMLRLCNTTVFMMGGQPDGCLPSISGNAPNATPCAGGTLTGTGQLSQTGGGVDWTAPNEHDVMTLPNGSPDPALAPAWTDVNGPEDLALWSESGTTASATYNMAGGAGFHVRGVFMVPNAEPFIISGGAHLDLTNAQYIATSIELSGATTQLSMSVDPNAGVTLPELKFSLVR